MTQFGGQSRRDLLKGMALGVGAGVVGSSLVGCSDRGNRGVGKPASTTTTTILAPGTRPDPTKPEGVDTLPEVEHIVIYMQENHSYDNIFGMLGRGDGFTIRDGKPVNSNPDAAGKSVPVFHATSTCDHVDGASQSWRSTAVSVNGGKMDGFIKASGSGLAVGSMQYWDGTDLPYYYALAKQFVLCDRWFGSAPCQTFPNRLFLQAGTSNGVISTDVNKALAAGSPPNGSIWERFNAHGISWANYGVDLLDMMLFPKFYEANRAHGRTPEQFLADAKAGTLPQVCMISPGHRRYTEESPSDLQLGEAYSASVINAVLHGPKWRNTVLFFTYDEHGGYYDHVAPPAAIPPDDVAPRLEPGDPPGAFDRLGPRVPAVVVSPFVKRDYVSSVVHDHTSILKFIETRFNLGALTFRDANADNLFDCFDFKNPGFPEPPELPAAAIVGKGSSCEPGTPLPPT
jgi:phospholipase C